MITHKGTQTIYTERLILRRFTVEDAQDMFDNWASDERVARFLTWPPHQSPDFTQQLLEGWCAAYENPGNYNWVIEKDGKAIGSVSVVLLNAKSEYADLGYCLGYAYWNQGIMSEAVKAVINFLFAEVGVNRIGISHAVQNPASGRVAQKCGLTYEGIRREYYKSKSGEFFDLAEYSILRREWG